MSESEASSGEGNGVCDASPLPRVLPDEAEKARVGAAAAAALAACRRFGWSSECGWIPYGWIAITSS